MNWKDKVGYAALALTTGVALHISGNAAKTQEDAKEIQEETRVLPEIARNFRETGKSIESVLNAEDYVDGNLLLTVEDFRNRGENFIKGFEQFQARRKTPILLRMDWAREEKLIQRTKIEWPVAEITKFGEFTTVDTTLEKPRAMVFDQWKMEKYFSKAFPYGWNSNLDSFEQVPKRIALPKDYGTEGSMAAATRLISEKGEPAAVEISYNELPVADRDAVLFTKTIAHEVCHANAFDTVQYVGLQDRLDLIKRLIERVFADNRFKSGYVESIGENSVEDKRTNYRKVSEYFAEICANWFEEPGKLHYEDAMLVENWIALIDADYDPASYREAKKVLLDSGEARDFEELAGTLAPLQKELLRVDVEAEYLGQKNAQLDKQWGVLKEELETLLEILRARRKGEMLIYNGGIVIRPLGEISKEMKQLEAEQKALEIRSRILDERRKVLKKQID